VQEIPLTGTHGRGFLTFVDDEDFELASRYSWRGAATIRNGELYTMYAVTGANTRYCDSFLMLHRLLCPVPAGLTVDHVNGNPLDNRRANLRPATRTQQMWNTAPKRMRNGIPSASPYKGVCRTNPYDAARPWAARIRVGGATVSLGRFQTEYEAACAYDAAAVKHFGAFARINGVALEIMLATG
jgi:hypothetical protein